MPHFSAPEHKYAWLSIAYLCTHVNGNWFVSYFGYSGIGDIGRPIGYRKQSCYLALDSKCITLCLLMYVMIRIKHSSCWDFIRLSFCLHCFLFLVSSVYFHRLILVVSCMIQQQTFQKPDIAAFLLLTKSLEC